jgi:uncharacterized protein
MKTKKYFFYFLAVFLLSCSFQLRAADSTNVISPASTNDYLISFDAVKAEWLNAAPEKIQAAATNGNATAQLFLAMEIIYDQSNTNIDQGIKWCRLAAEQGLISAQSLLGWIYGWDNRIEHDYNLAEKWMRRAAEQGSAEAQYEYGNLLLNEFDKDGKQITTNFPSASEWLKKSAEQGLAKAQYSLADMYNNGDLGNDQRSNCIPWFLKAAAQGNAAAQAEVGELPQLYPNSELLKSVDPIVALRQSAEQGNLDAQFQLAKRYQTGIGVTKDAVEAFKWMQKATQNDTASSRIGDAIYELALMYEEGEGVTQDLSESHRLYLLAASPVFFQRNATFRVGQMYENGEGVPQDDHRAAQFYSSGMCTTNDVYPNGSIFYFTPVEGDPEALFNLWSQGRGFPGDEKSKPGYRAPDDLITYWQGLIVTAKAEFYVGQIYYQGKLVPKDLVEAAARFHLAANLNLDDARKVLVQVESQMSAVQKEAEKSRMATLEKSFEQAKMIEEADEKAESVMPW